MKISGLENAGILRKVTLKKSVDAHSYCEIMMYIDGDVDTLRKFIGTDIVVEDNDRKLMRGKVCGVSINRSFTRSAAVFCAYSLSKSSDRKKHNRIYQSTNKMYSDIISKLEKTDCSFKITESELQNKRVPEPVEH